MILSVKKKGGDSLDSDFLEEILQVKYKERGWESYRALQQKGNAFKPAKIGQESANGTVIQQSHTHSFR